jgi:hypothetical protein
LIESHVARPVQLFVIETGAAEGIASRGDEQNYGAETFLTFRRTDELNQLTSFANHAVCYSTPDSSLVTRVPDDDSFV